MLPFYARLALERLQASESLRTAEMLDYLMHEYASQYREEITEEVRAQAHQQAHQQHLL